MIKQFSLASYHQEATTTISSYPYTIIIMAFGFQMREKKLYDDETLFLNEFFK